MVRPLAGREGTQGRAAHDNVAVPRRGQLDRVGDRPVVRVGVAARERNGGRPIERIDAQIDPNVVAHHAGLVLIDRHRRRAAGVGDRVLGGLVEIVAPRAVAVHEAVMRVNRIGCRPEDRRPTTWRWRRIPASRLRCPCRRDTSRR